MNRWQLQTPQAPGAPIFSFLQRWSEPPAVVLAFVLLELGGLRPVTVAQWLGLTPTAVSQWRQGRAETPRYMRWVLSALASDRLAKLEAFWLCSSAPMVRLICEFAEVPLAPDWREQATAALGELRQREAELYAANTMEADAIRKALALLRRRDLITPEAASLARAAAFTDNNIKAGRVWPRPKHPESEAQ